MGDLLVQNWFDLLSAIGIISSLLFTAVSLRSETKSRRISNLVALTQNHREVWAHFLYNKDLERVFDGAAEVSRHTVTREEFIFVTMVIQHLNSAFEAIQSGLAIKPEGVRRDVWQFFSLPIPRLVWEQIKILQNDDFVAFVENCRGWK